MEFPERNHLRLTPLLSVRVRPRNFRRTDGVTFLPTFAFYGRPRVLRLKTRRRGRELGSSGVWHLNGAIPVQKRPFSGRKGGKGRYREHQLPLHLSDINIILLVIKYKKKHLSLNKVCVRLTEDFCTVEYSFMQLYYLSRNILTEVWHI